MGLDPTTAITINGITCWDEGVKECFDKTNSSAIRTLIAAWDDSAALTNYFRGGTAPAGEITLYSPPIQYPRAPWLYVWQVRTEQIAVGGLTDENYPLGSLGVAKYARMFVEYRSLDYNPTETGSLSLEYNVDFVSPSRTDASFKWLTGAGVTGMPIQAADSPPLRIVTIGFVRTRKNLPSLPSALVRACSLAPVNSAAFYDAEVGTVLFEGAQATRRLMQDGSEGWDLTYRFTYKNCGTDSNGDIAGWNSLFCAITGRFEQIGTLAGGAPPLASSDLNQLLQ